MNCIGGTVKQETLVAGKGANSWEFINDMHLASGMYYLTLTMDNKAVTKRIIKD